MMQAFVLKSQISTEIGDKRKMVYERSSIGSKRTQTLKINEILC